MTRNPAQQFAIENRFYRNLGVGLAIFAALVFATTSLGGFTDIAAMPRTTQLHAIAMSAWLALFAVQNILGAGANIPLHRKLGWAGVILAVIVVATGIPTPIATLSANRVPPIFGHGYFLMLGLVHMALFSAFIIAAVLMRKRTDWHRRLMLGSLIVIFEPVLGRILLIATTLASGGGDPVGELPPRAAMEAVRVAMHLLIVVPIILRDRNIRGSVHPALWVLLGAVVLGYAIINFFGFSTTVMDYAERLVSG